MSNGIAAMPSRYRQPNAGITNIEMMTIKQVPTAQNNYNNRTVKHAWSKKESLINSLFNT